MLTKVEVAIKTGNQITGYQNFWVHDPLTDFSDKEILGEVSAEDLMGNPAAAEEAYCGDGDSVRTLEEIVQFVDWLVGHGYPLPVAMHCAANLLVFHAE